MLKESSLSEIIFWKPEETLFSIKKNQEKK